MMVGKKWKKIEESKLDFARIYQLEKSPNIVSRIKLFSNVDLIIQLFFFSGQYDHETIKMKEMNISFLRITTKAPVRKEFTQYLSGKKSLGSIL